MVPQPSHSRPSADPGPDEERGAGAPRRFSIAVYLGIGLGGLITTVLCLLLWVTLSAMFKNTTELLSDKSRIFLGSLSAQTRQYLDATLAPSMVAANQMSRGIVDPKIDGEMMPLMRTLLAATPEVTELVFFDAGGTLVIASRRNGKVLTARQNWFGQEDVRASMESIQEGSSTVWGPPVYTPETGSFINLRRPVFRDETFLGMMTVTINLSLIHI